MVCAEACLVNRVLPIVDNLQMPAFNPPMSSVADLVRSPLRTRPTLVPGAETSEGQQALALLRSRSLADAVLAAIRERILGGLLAPGAKLTESHWVAELGVSRGPIREAFRMLEEAGLVRTEKNRGVFVRELPLVEALELYELRGMMDEAAGRSLAERATLEQLKHLRSLVAQMEQAVKAGALDDYHVLNLAFHDAIVAFAGNGKLTALYRKLTHELALLRRRNLAQARLLPASVREHRGILKAIAAGDAQAAGQALREHALQSQQRAKEFYR
jgi:phosphonate utilization transcriptional regulator